MAEKDTCIKGCEGCFANVNGECFALTKVEEGCHFYKTTEEAKEGLKKYPAKEGTELSPNVTKRTSSSSVA